METCSDIALFLLDIRKKLQLEKHPLQQQQKQSSDA